MSRCSCCGMDKVTTPRSLDNRPGLEALRYRVGTHASFFQTMKRQLSSTQYPALKDLTTRETGDFSLALLDAWAMVGDVLTFYQERIANEGYLRTSTEERSIVELARLVNYRLRPGVAASVYVAYLLEPDSETVIPAGSRIQSVPAAEELAQTFETSTKLVARAGWNTMKPRLKRPSVLSSDMATLYLKGTNHNLEPNSRLLFEMPSEEEDSAIKFVKRIKKIEIDFTVGETKVQLQDVSSDTPSLQEPTSTFQSLHSMVAPLSKAPSGHPPNSWRLSRQAGNVFSSQSEIVPRLLEDFYPRIRYSLSQALSHARVAPEPFSKVFAFRTKSAPFGHNAPLKPVTDPLTGRVVGSEEWPLAGDVVYAIELTPNKLSHISDDDVPSLGTLGTVRFIQDLKAEVSLSIGVQRWRHAFTLDSWEGSESPFVQRFSLGDTQVVVTFTSDDQRNALQFAFANPTLHISKSLLYVWIPGEQGLRAQIDDAPEISLTIGQSLQTRVGPMNEQQVSLGYGWSFSKILRLTAEIAAPNLPIPNQLFLDVEKEGIVPGSRVLVERPGASLPPATVEEVLLVSKNDYGVSGRVTQLTLDENWLDPETDLFLDVARDATVYVQSELLELADEPFEEPVQGARITLDGYYPGLEPGRWLIVEGTRTDVPNMSNFPGKELVMLSAVEHDVGRLSQERTQPLDGPSEIPANGVSDSFNPIPGDSIHTTLILSQPLAYTYQRESVHIYGNVVHATHGETRAQVLGSADASRPFQQFTLQQAPLTFVSDSSEEGVDSSLEVRVNNVQWEEASNLVHQGAEDRVFMAQRNAEGHTAILFGNGIHGLRPTTGIENVSASFRIGIGKSGNVMPKQISVALDRPLGVREVINPLPASGGANPEGLESARRNVSRGLKTLGRIVSLTDYEHFACSFAGIGKAKAVSLSHGQQEIVHLTIAGVDDSPIDEQSDVFQNLFLALTRFGDAYHVVQLGIRERLLVVLKAHVRLYADYRWEDVAPRLRATLLNALSFENRDLGEPLYLSQTLHLLQSHAGVQYVHVEIFDVLKQNFTEKSLAHLVQTKKPQQSIPVQLAHSASKGSAIWSAQIAYLSPAVPDTLILTLMD